MSTARIPLKTRNENENLIPSIKSSEKITPEKNKQVVKPLQRSQNTVRKGLQPNLITQQKQIKCEPRKRSTFTVYNDDFQIRPQQRQKSEIKTSKASVLKPNLFDDDIFSEIDTPIYNLPTDCLISIFKLCRGFENYCSLLGVCRRWRSIASQPFLWRELDCEWSVFSKQIDLLHQPRRTFVQFEYIRTLTLTNKHKTVIRDPTIDIVKIPPIKQLTELRLIDLDLTDISFLISWQKDITKLHCENIQITDNRSVNIVMFSGLRQLESLYLHFARPSALGHAYFTLTRDENRKLLYKRLFPQSLRVLSINNTYDYEETLYSATTRDLLVMRDSDQDDIIVRWLQLEEKLVQKYQIFTSLHSLTSLSLGRVSAFTSRVWRQCLIPCSTKLEYLKMKHWEGLGKRESPQKYFERARTSMLRRGTNEMDDVELALSEFISSLKNIKKIELHCFRCGPGIMNGLKRLKQRYRLVVDNNDGGHIEDFQDKLLLDFKIIFLKDV
ncbi:uncharacterized protein BX663DRAFT_307584 [Cokeromyces recurvatus]|uniref:uncharacterized protein n=1 Tax=Cokeromyces recurvatus TaxID=90255 RepID=UPI00221F4318|nr:uncharacterized protein BX663DRAFT_307584 [Cokeromyces recurvatus]KAI7905005.1 hypothetical protein BX663DRAFT_307584 [Cokeromyces recurvatus]